MPRIHRRRADAAAAARARATRWRISPRRAAAQNARAARAPRWAGWLQTVLPRWLAAAAAAAAAACAHLMYVAFMTVCVKHSLPSVFSKDILFFKTDNLLYHTIFGDRFLPLPFHSPLGLLLFFPSLHARSPPSILCFISSAFLSPSLYCLPFSSLPACIAILHYMYIFL